MKKDKFKQHKILAVNSFPSNGTAGLKMVLSILGSRVIPIPSLLLSGTGNMEGHKRYPVPFEDLLYASLSMARSHQERLIFFVGYLGDAGQHESIAQALESFKDIIDYVIIDPVSGDNGKLYVSQEIASGWPILLQKADLATPNITELSYLAGQGADRAYQQGHSSIELFKERYPGLDFIVTGLHENQALINRYYGKKGILEGEHSVFPGHYTGAGDTFTSLYIFFRFLQGFSKENSLKLAGHMMVDFVREAWENERNTLMVNSFPEKFLEEKFNQKT